MALANAIQGAKRPSQSITWTREDDTPEDLTGATITAKIFRHNTSTSGDVTGAFVVTSAAAGVFRWDYSTADVATAGSHKVQFTATFGGSPTPAKTKVSKWVVESSI